MEPGIGNRAQARVTNRFRIRACGPLRNDDTDVHG